MTELRAEIRERALATAADTFPAGMLADVTGDEVAAAIDEYQQEHDLADLAERGSEMYATSQVLRRVMLRRGSLFEYSEWWPAPMNVLQRLPLGPLSRIEKLEFLDVLKKTHEWGPAGYAELVDGYVSLTDGLLDDLRYATHGDPVEGEDVSLVCERDGRRFEAILETEDRRVDVDGLGALLDRVAAETTDTDRRFCWTRVERGFTVGVWFVTDDNCQTLATYYAEARDSATA